MSLVRCNICRGLKEHAPLGFIKIKCVTCNGSGYIDSSTILLPILNPYNSNVMLLSNDNNVIKKKKKKRRKNSNPILDTLIMRVDNATTL